MKTLQKQYWVTYLLGSLKREGVHEADAWADKHFASNEEAAGPVSPIQSRVLSAVTGA